MDGVRSIDGGDESGPDHSHAVVDHGGDSSCDDESDVANILEQARRNERDGLAKVLFCLHALVKAQDEIV